MNAFNKVRLGIIGTGSIGTIHMKQFSELPDVELTAVMNNTLSIARERAKKFGIKKVYSNSRDLIQDVHVDAVIIATPNKFHSEMATQALKAGKHVLLEKPMGMNADDSKDIVHVLKDSKKVFMLGHHRRWDPFIMKAKEFIDKGALGHIYYVKTGYIRRKGIPGWGSWFTQKKDSGGGALMDIGVHMLDLAIWMMGEIKPISVYGTVFSELGTFKKGIGSWGKQNWNGYFDVDELASAQIKMDNGSVLNLEVSWAAHTETDNAPFIHLMGTKGGISVREHKGVFMTELLDHKSDINFELPKLDEGPRKRMSQHFIDCIRKEEKPITSAMSGLLNNMVIDAIYRSSYTGSEVKLNVDM
ncbi:Gfo/Idh/MocA family protein [Oceanobacillus damuensis]|uniref:Gfo/Idh/MocA family protein n=1 Tax=Oceanobacillus damuensis TaxID=937928 RepID=UPI00082B44E9|nr:Gfo/Idh/MocA family oxidoreductase [Oceanobacillus damuensis]